MASSLLALLDDIASILDDVSVLTKVATGKTAGVLGDDLALNAQQVTGVAADRELPVVWAVAKGSLKNKAILVPGALLLSALAPWAITPLMIVGGLFLCFEGAEKVVHKLLLSKEEDASRREELARAVLDPTVDLVALEKDKIKGAIRTDFILSAEIIVITLGTVATAALVTRVAVLVSIAILMTIGVYGLVAGIVKLDDGAFVLARSRSRAARGLGSWILAATPWLMKGLSVAGTAAMFLVGGGILLHGFSYLQQGAEHWAELVGTLPGIGVVLGPIAMMLLNLLTGLVAGAVIVAIVSVVRRFMPSLGGAPAE
jgi:predicted DNA repair protein MutK